MHSLTLQTPCSDPLPRPAVAMELRLRRSSCSAGLSSPSGPCGASSEEEPASVFYEANMTAASGRLGLASRQQIELSEREYVMPGKSRAGLVLVQLMILSCLRVCVRVCLPRVRKALSCRAGVVVFV